MHAYDLRRLLASYVGTAMCRQANRADIGIALHSGLWGGGGKPYAATIWHPILDRPLNHDEWTNAFRLVVTAGGDILGKLVQSIFEETTFITLGSRSKGHVQGAVLRQHDWSPPSRPAAATSLTIFLETPTHLTRNPPPRSCTTAALIVALVR
ncbi:MAG: hypothetical protein ACYDAG_04305, partial [Chloroflexota bacterium]